MSYGQQDRAGSASIAPKNPTVASAIESLDPLLGRLETMLQRAANAADQIQGNRPSLAGKDEKNPSAQSLISQLFARRERLAVIVEGLEMEITRIETGLL